MPRPDLGQPASAAGSDGTAHLFRPDAARARLLPSAPAPCLTLALSPLNENDLSLGWSRGALPAESFSTYMHEVLSTTLLVTIFVVQMMVIIEFLHERSRAHMTRIFRVDGFLKYVLAATIGVIPGCLGPLTVSAIYSHGLISFGSIVAGMVAATGDEAFVLLAMAPQRAWWIFGAVLALGIVAGVASDSLTRLFHLVPDRPCHTLDVPCEAGAAPAHPHAHAPAKTWSAGRIFFAVLATMPVLLFGAGILHVDEGSWVRVGLIAVSLATVWVVVASDDHFLLKHVKVHIIRKHAPRILLWTFGAMLFLHWATNLVNLQPALHWGPWPILLVACLIGLIPESGPHVIFITLFAEGTIPLSILLANSIVQDGHGMLPLLAESRKSFIQIKAVKLLFGLLVGGLLISLGM